MNCKQGDLAVIVKYLNPKSAASVGTIVKCMQLVSNNKGLPGWLMDRPVLGRSCVLDCALRPLRNNPGADETLTWLPVPSTNVEKENV